MNHIGAWIADANDEVEILGNDLPMAWEVSFPVPGTSRQKGANSMRRNDLSDEELSAKRIEMVVRTLRHEVGDLLQSVYSAVAILQERLPAQQSLERGILADLRNRAELCKHELDAVHDLVLPLNMNPSSVDLADWARNTLAASSLRFPALQFNLANSQPVIVQADVQRLTQAANLLMLSFCQAARKTVSMSTAAHADTRQGEWSLAHDGAESNPELLSWLESAFTTTRQARFGLGLALARRIVELQGGAMRAKNLPEGGFSISLLFPLAPLSR
jgi:signal transduction histidine kinase